MAYNSPGIYSKITDLSARIYADDADSNAHRWASLGRIYGSDQIDKAVLWADIARKAETNPALKELMEKCEAYYRLLDE